MKAGPEITKNFTGFYFELHTPRQPSFSLHFRAAESNINFQLCVRSRGAYRLYPVSASSNETTSFPGSIVAKVGSAESLGTSLEISPRSFTEDWTQESDRNPAQPRRKENPCTACRYLLVITVTTCFVQGS